MSDAHLQPIYHYRRASERLGTSGMPTEAQLADIAAAGFELVINLDQCDSDYALPDERGAVEALGMTYVPIPVLWEGPAHEDLAAFLDAMAQHADKQVFVHCVANYRASVFMALYRIRALGWVAEDALADLHAMWQPNETWQAFIDRELSG